MIHLATVVISVPLHVNHMNWIYMHECTHASHSFKTEITLILYATVETSIVFSPITVSCLYVVSVLLSTLRQITEKKRNPTEPGEFIEGQDISISVTDSTFTFISARHNGGFKLFT